jgi:phosphoenolpyruvate-protein kinase (PTS system EI component)
MTTTYSAVTCSPGVALASGWRPRGAVPDPAPPAAAVTAAAVGDAFEATAAHLDRLAGTFRGDGVTAYADILEAEALIARDPAFLAEVIALLEGEGVGAVTAVTRVAGHHAELMAGLESADLRERAADIRQVGRMVIDRLGGRVQPTPPAGPFVLLAEEVTAPDLLEYAEQLAGAVSVLGGPASHASIVARSLGVPLIVGVQPTALAAADGATVLVDGDTGAFVVAPDPAAVATLQARAAGPSAAELAAARALPARTIDGTDVTLLANVASGVEARRALEAGASGVGLLRTELPFLDAHDWPSLDQHEAALRPVLAALHGRSVTVRLLDFTHDKVPPFLRGRGDESSLALLLAHGAALDSQLRAVIVAGRDVDLRLMLPMVTCAEELEQVRARLSPAAHAVGVDRLPPLGAMLESPAAIEALPELAGAADFFSLGTNDLTASTLGLDRSDPQMTPALATDPAVLSLVERAVVLCGQAGRPLSLCGDAGADPLAFPRLLAVGVRTFSVAPSRLDQVRAMVRAASVTSERDALLSEGAGSGA